MLNHYQRQQHLSTGNNNGWPIAYNINNELDNNNNQRLPNLRYHVFVSKETTKELADYILPEPWGEASGLLYKYLDYIWRCQLFDLQVKQFMFCNEPRLLFHTGLQRRSDGEYIYLLLIKNNADFHKNVEQKWRVALGIQNGMNSRNASFVTRIELHSNVDKNECIWPWNEDLLPHRTLFIVNETDLIFRSHYKFSIDWEERLRTCKTRIYKTLSNDGNRKGYGNMIDESILPLSKLQAYFEAETNKSLLLASANPRVGVPQAFIESKTGGYRLELLIPLTLKFNGRLFYFALALRPYHEQQLYEGMSILTREMAYANARLVGSIDSSWLSSIFVQNNTGLSTHCSCNCHNFCNSGMSDYDPNVRRVTSTINNSVGNNIYVQNANEMNFAFNNNSTRNNAFMMNRDVYPHQFSQTPLRNITQTSQPTWNSVPVPLLPLNPYLMPVTPDFFDTNNTSGMVANSPYATIVNHQNAIQSLPIQYMPQRHYPQHTLSIPQNIYQPRMPSPLPSVVMVNSPGIQLINNGSNAYGYGYNMTSNAQMTNYNDRNVRRNRNISVLPKPTLINTKVIPVKKTTKMKIKPLVVEKAHEIIPVETTENEIHCSTNETNEENINSSSPSSSSSSAVQIKNNIRRVRSQPSIQDLHNRNLPEIDDKIDDDYPLSPPITRTTSTTVNTVLPINQEFIVDDKYSNVNDFQLPGHQVLAPHSNSCIIDGNNVGNKKSREPILRCLKSMKFPYIYRENERSRIITAVDAHTTSLPSRRQSNYSLSYSELPLVNPVTAHQSFSIPDFNGIEEGIVHDNNYRVMDFDLNVELSPELDVNDFVDYGPYESYVYPQEQTQLRTSKSTPSLTLQRIRTDNYLKFNQPVIIHEVD